MPKTGHYYLPMTPESLIACLIAASVRYFPFNSSPPRSERLCKPLGQRRAESRRIWPQMALVPWVVVYKERLPSPFGLTPVVPYLFATASYGRFCLGVIERKKQARIVFDTGLDLPVSDSNLEPGG